jgi:hypothetical protein
LKTLSKFDDLICFLREMRQHPNDVFRSDGPGYGIQSMGEVWPVWATEIQDEPGIKMMQMKYWILTEDCV